MESWIEGEEPFITKPKEETMGTINIIGAMEEELSGLRAAMCGDPHRDGFVVRHSGVGKVNAVLAVTRAHQWDARCIISVGTAGALAPKLGIGDVIIVDRAVQHDIDASPVGFPRGTIPFEQQSVWSADETLVRSAAHAISACGYSVIIGAICSGERFVADGTEKLWLRKQFGGTCIDMETGAIAQACAKLGIPWFGIRIISDGADRGAAVDFQSSLALASDRIAQIIPKLVSILSPQ